MNNHQYSRIDLEELRQKIKELQEFLEAVIIEGMQHGRDDSTQTR